MLYRISFTLFLLLSIYFAQAQSWKAYPYHQAGSVLNFPDDEGYHPGQVAEWWYTNAHITGDSTGTDYSCMLTYFYYPSFGFDGFRILELSNESTGQFFQETQPCKYPTLSQDHLEIKANTGVSGSNHEDWETLKDTLNNLLPFQYHLHSASANGSADLTYSAVKRPLMIGGTGFLYQGISGYTYYYSQTELEVTGRITIKGVTEKVHGIAWIDRQWGQFDPSTGEKYAWFSLQLSNGMDLNLWNLFNTQNQIPDTSTYRFCTAYLSDTIDTTLSNFTLQRLKYAFTTDKAKCYDQQWQLTFGNVDLTITANHINNEVTLPFRFYEGSVTITGTVNGQPVSGVGYAELLHSFVNPQVAIISPAGHSGWDATTPITWQLLNPDDGRPVRYDVALSTDNKTNFTTLATHLADTSYKWMPNLTHGTEGWIRITAYSIDSTLTGTAISDSSFIFGAAGIKEVNNVVSVLAFPNPLTANTTISYGLKDAGKVQIDILNEEGILIKSYDRGFEAQGQHQLGLDITDNLAAGIYFYRICANGNYAYGKLANGK